MDKAVYTIQSGDIGLTFSLATAFSAKCLLICFCMTIAKKARLCSLCKSISASAEVLKNTCKYPTSTCLFLLSLQCLRYYTQYRRRFEFMFKVPEDCC